MGIKKSIVEFLETLGHRWRLAVLVALKEGSMSSDELIQKLSQLYSKDIAATTFSAWAVSLCDLGLISRERDPHTNRFTYTLTPLGQSALEVYSFAAEKMEGGLKEHQLQKIEEDTW